MKNDEYINYEPAKGDTKKGKYMGDKTQHSMPKSRQDGVNQDRKVKAEDHQFTQEHADKGECY